MVIPFISLRADWNDSYNRENRWVEVIRSPNKPTYFRATVVLLTPGTKILLPDNRHNISASAPVRIEAYLFILVSGSVYPPITVLIWLKEDVASSIVMVFGEKS